MDEKTFNKCKDQGLRFLVLREHNRKELEMKIINKGYEKSLVEDVLNSLEEEGSLSEERYCEVFIRSNNKKHPEGKSLMLQRLLSKGANKEVAVKVVEENYTRDYVTSLVNKGRESLIKKGKGSNEDEIRLGLRKAGFTSSDMREI